MLIWGMATGLLTWMAIAIMVVINWNRLPPQIPLWYSLPVGEAQLAEKDQLVYVLGGYLGLMVANIVIARSFKNTTRLLSIFMVWGGAVAMILLGLTVVRIFGNIL